LIRRAVRFGRDLGIHVNFCGTISNHVVDLFMQVYPELEQHRAHIAETMDAEETRFKATLERALRFYQKVVDRMLLEGRSTISGEEAFDLYETYGFPLPFTVELAKEQGLEVDEAGFETCYSAHRQESRQALDDKFKGGLADHSDQTTRLHTASHLLQAALRQVLGTEVRQMGSNITPERLRFDFSHSEKVNQEQLMLVEQIVNSQIEAGLPVMMGIMPLEKAIESGALAFFGEKYGELVKVYSIGSFSKEVCGGPHVNNSRELGHFRINKEEAVGRGVRRIRAVLD
jgi:alanyl-tRNA synthetase